MTAPTNYFIDPSLDSDTGVGTLGDPFGDLQYALNEVGTSPGQGANGDKFNVQNTADEVLTAPLSLATYGNPTAVAPLIFKGYTSSADDGGVGGIDGNGGAVFEATATQEKVIFIDLRCHNSGSSTILELEDNSLVFRCELDDTTGDAIHLKGGECQVVRCNIHNIGTMGIRTDKECYVLFNYLKNGTNDFLSAIKTEGFGTTTIGNIISIDGASKGIQHGGSDQLISGNSILSSGGTGIGIWSDGSGRFQSMIINNLIEGFSGAGGVGIDTSVMTTFGSILAGNALFNNTTNYDTPNYQIISYDNETLSASPFAKSGADTFVNRFTYFAPVVGGNVRGGAFVG